MSNFIENLVARHTEVANPIKPRVRGLFEPVNNVTDVFATNSSLESEEKLEMPSVEYPTDIGLENSRNRLSNQVDNSASNFVENNPILKQQQAAFGPFVAPTKPIVETKSQLTINNSEHQPFIPTPQIQNLIIPNTKASNLLVRKENNSTNKDAVKEEKNAAITNNHPDESQDTAVIKPIPRSNEPIQPVVNKSDSPNGVSTSVKETAWLQDLKTASESYFNPNQAPVIKVTIGRIEVRAITQAAPPIVKSTPAPKPRLTLEDYLKQQNSNSK